MKTKEDKQKDVKKLFRDFRGKLFEYGIENKLEKDADLAEITLLRFSILFDTLYGENSLHQLIQMLFLISRKEMVENPNEYMCIRGYKKSGSNKKKPDYVG